MEGSVNTDFIKRFLLQKTSCLGHVDKTELVSYPDGPMLEIHGWMFSLRNVVKEIKFSFGKTHTITLSPTFRRDIFTASNAHPFSILSGYKACFEVGDLKFDEKKVTVAFEAVLSSGDVEKGFLLDLPIEDRTGAGAEKTPDGHEEHVRIFRKLIWQEYLSFLNSSKKIVLSKEKAPSISIVILSYNNPDILYKCLKSLTESTSTSFEVIIVDNNSDQDTQDFLDRVVGAKIIRNNSNVHFVKGSNQGAKFARSNYLLFLNSDCFVFELAVDRALAYLMENKNIGVVGAKLLRADGAIFESGCVVHEKTASTEFLGYGMDARNPLYSINGTADYVSGAFLLTRTSLFKKLKGFDLKYSPAYYEDVDFCHRVRLNNYTVNFCGEAVGVHLGNASSQNRIALESLIERNRQKFKRVLQRTPSRKGIPFGVNVVGLYNSEKGVGESVRQNINSLVFAKIPVAINPLFDVNSSNIVKSDTRFLSKTNPYKINLVHVHPPGIHEIPATFGSNYFDKRYNIAYWVWEQEQLPSSWPPYISYFDEIWTPSTYSKEIFEKYTDKPIIKIPHAIETKFQEIEVIPELAKLRLEQKFVYLFIYDSDSSIIRKNPRGLVQAFLKIFAKKKDAVLLIKSSRGKLFSDKEREFVRLLSNNVILIDKIFNRSQMNYIYSLAKVYISLHRSEGFGLTLAESMSRGILTIGTGYSGNLDFMNANNSLLVNYRRTALRQTDAFYPMGGFWAEPDLNHASELIKYAYNNYDNLKPIAENGRKFIASHFGIDHVSTLIEKRVSEIRSLL